MLGNFDRRLVLAAPLSMLGLLACSAAPEAGSPESTASTQQGLSEDTSSAAAGAVFTIDNASDANHVLAFERGRDGSLTAAGAFATGGTGTGAGLGTQGALAFALDGRVLIVVNAGSNDISSFTVSGAHLRLRSRVASGGVSPESVAAHDHLVYALNGGAPNGVSGFWLTDDGELFALPGSTQTLSGASVAPAQVGFTPRGRELVVTERGTSDIDVLPLGGDGLPRERLTFASAGTTPYGFAFSRGTLVVSDAFGGAAGAGAVSSYALDEGGSLVDVSQAVPDGQSAPCWVAATGDGRWAVTTNAHSGTISAYGVADDGSLTLGATSSTGEGSTPIDLGFDARSEHLYVLDAGNHAIEGYVLGAGGALTSVAALGGLPASATGIVAR